MRSAKLLNDKGFCCLVFYERLFKLKHHFKDLPFRFERVNGQIYLLFQLFLVDRLYTLSSIWVLKELFQD